MKKKTIRFLSAFTGCLILLLTVFSPVCAAYGADDISSVADGVIQWRKVKNKTPADGYLFSGSFAKTAGNGCDWYMIGAGRYGIKDDSRAYLANIGAYITEKYKTPNKLDRAKATEWHRIALAVTAAGGNPTAIGRDENGTPVNLIADGVYNRGNTASLGKQGLNGWIWGLITLDSKNYSVPQGSYYTREQILKEILSYQLSDGGFSFAGTKSDSDTTAAALIALGSYKNDNTRYTYTLKRGKQEVTKTVPQIVSEALGCLSEIQLSSGGFTASGEETSESTSQIIIALCSLGVDPQKDSRFIKDGGSPVDALLRYRQSDGGIAHLFDGGSDSIAGEQALCALVSLYRLYHGMARLYDYTDDVTMIYKSQQNGGASGSSSSQGGASGGGLPAQSESHAGQTGGTVASGQTPSDTGASQNSMAVSGTDGQTTSSNNENDSSQSKTQSTHSSQEQAAAAWAGASSGQSGEKVQSGSSGSDDDGINPTIFIIIGAALAAGGLGFNFSKRRNQKTESEKDDFFESLKAYRDENSESKTQENNAASKTPDGTAKQENEHDE